MGLAASGVSRAWAWALCWPGRAGGGPIRAPSQNLPLSLVTAASLPCLAQVQPPHKSPLRAVALPSRFSRLGALVGRALSKPQFPHLKTGRTGLLVPSDPAHQDPGTTTPGEHAGAALFPPSHPMLGAARSTPVSPGLHTHGEVAPSLSLRSSSIRWGDGCSDGASLPMSQTGHRTVAAPPSLPLFFHFFIFRVFSL